MVDDSQPSLLRRYALPVMLGTVLGVALLYLLSQFAKPPPDLEPAKQPTDEASALVGDNPGVIVTVPEPRRAPESGDAAASAGPPPCTGDTETIDCLLATLDSKWRVGVAVERSDGEVPTVTAPVGGRLRWPVVSQRGGLVTSFVVESDGGVLLIYPSPGGASPEAQPGVSFDVPRRIDNVGMKWNRPGLRRVFVLISTVPFVAPEGIAAGKVATYYGAGDPASSFFRTLREQVHADQASGDGEWAVGEARFDVRDDG